MTEYALILAAVAIVVFITYEVMGQDGFAHKSSLAGQIMCSQRLLCAG
jgi:hypothetical protein